jgi:hypothetical protein
MSFGDDIEDVTPDPARDARIRIAELLPHLSNAEVVAVLQFAVRLELARIIRLERRRR